MKKIILSILLLAYITMTMGQSVLLDPSQSTIVQVADTDARMTLNGTDATPYPSLQFLNNGSFLGALYGNYLNDGVNLSNSTSTPGFFWKRSNTRGGIGTFDPEAKLHIYANGTGTVPQLKLTENNNSDGSRIMFENFGSTNNWTVYGLASDVSSSALFNIFNPHVGNILSIRGNGRVGIGITDPDNALHVVGNDIKIEDSFPFLVLETTGTTGNAGIQIKQQSTTRGYVYYENSSSALKINATSAGTGAGGLNVKSSGFVGIGTESPNRILEISDASSPFIRISDVSGGSDVGIELMRIGTGFNDWRIRNSGGEIDFQVSTNDLTSVTTEFTMSTTGFRPGIDNSNDLGTSTFRWDDVFATNGTIQTSDRREKENIQNLKYGLNEVLKMKPVSYTWITSPEKGTKVGLIAQDIAELVPEVVNGLENGKVGEERLGMNYGELVPVLIKAIQEQQKVIAGLEKTNSELTASIEAINKVLGIENKVSNSRR